MPVESSLQPSLLVDESRRIRFDISDQIRKGDVGFEAQKDVNMVPDTVDSEEFLVLVPNDTRDKFVELFLVLGSQNILPTLNSKNHLNIDLRICICHRSPPVTFRS